MWLHAFAYLPSAAINSLLLIVGDTETNFTYLLDDTAVWLIVFWAANAGLIAHTFTFLIYLLYVIVKLGSTGYTMLFIIYGLQAAFMQYY
mmetsp:Transcript_42715/g.56394  ORF Transcript_42715/g.56394 Transcript_42715/m.56394 type:complete len:90 (+) Transcript_42715:346-615(+)